MKNHVKAGLFFAGIALLGLGYLILTGGSPLATSGPQRLPPILYTAVCSAGLLVGIGLILNVDPLVSVIVEEE